MRSSTSSFFFKINKPWVVYGENEKKKQILPCRLWAAELSPDEGFHLFYEHKYQLNGRRRCRIVNLHDPPEPWWSKARRVDALLSVWSRISYSKACCLTSFHLAGTDEVCSKMWHWAVHGAFFREHSDDAVQRIAFFWFTFLIHHLCPFGIRFCFLCGKRANLFQPS